MKPSKSIPVTDVWLFGFGVTRPPARPPSETVPPCHTMRPPPPATTPIVDSSLLTALSLLLLLLLLHCAPAAAASKTFLPVARSDMPSPTVSMWQTCDKINDPSSAACRCPCDSTLVTITQRYPGHLKCVDPAGNSLGGAEAAAANEYGVTTIDYAEAHLRYSVLLQEHFRKHGPPMLQSITLSCLTDAMPVSAAGQQRHVHARTSFASQFGHF